MSCKEIKLIVKELKSVGYEVKLNKGHYKILQNNKTILSFAGTPSDSRAIKNIRSDIRKRKIL